MTIAGRATSAGTLKYSERFKGRAAEGHFRKQQDLNLSSIGIGTYLGNADDSTDKSYLEAIIEAVKLGINVIDSAANYRFQRSERVIGDAFTRLTEELGFSREELII